MKDADEIAKIERLIKVLGISREHPHNAARRLDEEFSNAALELSNYLYNSQHVTTILSFLPIHKEFTEELTEKLRIQMIKEFRFIAEKADERRCGGTGKTRSRNYRQQNHS